MGERRRAAVTTGGVVAMVLALLTVLPGAGAPAAAHGDPGAETAATPTLPQGFSDTIAIGGISEATTVAFAPDGTAFVALKTGQIKSFDYDATSEQFEGASTATDFADLRDPVNNYWDRGLTGITLDPAFGTSGHDYVYVSYTYNRDPRDATPVVPKWGDPAEAYDECPAPATTDPPAAGCAVMMRVSRLTAQKGSLGWTMVAGSEKQLLAGGCFQFGSHASGDVIFGPDGKLYVSAGEGASFDTNDYGQYANPCGDPSDEGGSLRAQDYRSTGDPLGIDGTIVRLDPSSELTPTQATANSWLVAYGQRNPWRLAFRPGTTQLWSGDVGASGYEEVNRLDTATTVQTPVNRGWPCYEGAYTGNLRNEGWAALDKPLCRSLYAAVAADPSTVSSPYFSYQTRGPKLVAGEDCKNETSSVSGVAFTPTDSQATDYPAAYRGAMFFSDYARSCVWMLGKKANGDPDPTTIVPFVQGAATPVQLKTGPGGDLYYVDYGLNDEGGVVPGGAAVHRIVYTGANAVPTAKITADKTSGTAPLTVTLDGGSSTDPDGDTLTYSWDLDGNGTYGDSTAAKPTKTYAAGTWTVGLKVNDGHGHTSPAATLQVQAGNTAPVIGTTSPANRAAYTVGQSVAFSATASDTQDGTLPASAFSWQLSIRHCPSGVCHTHSLQTFNGVSSGSFPAPDHEYPSYLLLTLTVTDSGGLTATREIELDPTTVPLSFASSPSGATVTLTSGDHATPYSETFLQGSRLTMTAAPTMSSGGETWAFGSWSDGGTRSHELSAPAAATTYTATYTRPTATLTASPTSGIAPLPVTYTASATSPGGSSGMTYAWDLDDDGAFDDGAGTTQSVTWTVSGSPVVRVRATDARGATDTKAVTVTVANTAPTARITTSGSSGNAPLTVAFDATTSSDVNGDPLTYDWDLDGNGTYETSGAKPSRTYSAVGATTVGLRVSDGHGGIGTASVVVTAQNGAPTITTMSPTDATTYAVGQVLALSASAADPQETLPSSAYAWKVERQDCASGCARSTVTTSTGPTASLTVPELPNPSRLVVTLTVTDSNGGSTSRSVVLQPRTTTLRVTTDPAGGSVDVGGTTQGAPYDVTLVQGAHLTLTAPPTQAGGWTFSGWSDGGAQSHTITVPTSATTLTASYAAPVVTPGNSAPVVTGLAVFPGATFAVGQTLGFDASASDAEQALPDSAYAFTLERQDCATGCPRQVVRTWVGVHSGQLVVPAMALPSHLYLTVSVTDAQGLVASRTVAIEPRAAVLTVTTKAGTTRQSVVAGSSVTVTAAKKLRKKGVRWVFARWSDGGARSHAVVVGETGLALRALYRRR